MEKTAAIAASIPKSERLSSFTQLPARSAQASTDAHAGQSKQASFSAAAVARLEPGHSAAPNAFMILCIAGVEPRNDMGTKKALYSLVA